MLGRLNFQIDLSGVRGVTSCGCKGREQVCIGCGLANENNQEPLSGGVKIPVVFTASCPSAQVGQEGTRHTSGCVCCYTTHGVLRFQDPPLHPDVVIGVTRHRQS